MTNDSDWKQRIPIILSTFLVIVSLYLFTWSWSKVASIVATQYKDEPITYAASLFGEGQSIHMLVLILFGIVAGFTWVLSTRVTFYQTKFMRVFVFFLALTTVWGSLAVYGMNKTRQHFIPFFEERLANVIVTSGFFESIVFEHTHGFYLMLTLLPVFMMFFITLFLLTKYIQHDKVINEAFFEYQWSGVWIQKFSKWEETDYWPDVVIGPDSKTGELVTIPGRDRTLNTKIVGPIGTGKSAALGLPIINQDLTHITKYINDYPKMYQLPDFESETVGGRYVSGISIIEPSNDLCQLSLKLVKAHGIPDEAITYIDPTNPETVAINAMRGPVDKVAEVFTQVIDGLNNSKDGGNFFFQQAQRNHLKYYIYLLKLHDLEKEVTLDMLLDMYNNPQLVRKMHVELKTTFPTDYENFESRDERNYWKIVQGVDEWFELNLLPEVTRQGTAVYSDGGEIKYYDAKAEHVQGLRNILNDIGANLLIRRVLFGKSDFDFDRHMSVGGVLLVNTAKGELGSLGSVLGRVVLMNLQFATFRRAPKVSTFHHIVIDEAPDYLYNSFREFPAQSRKYKVIITTLMQTIAQLADQFGEHYMTTIIAAMRNRMVFGDVPDFDAQYFSSMFGEKFVYDEGQNEMSVSPLQEDPMSRSGSSYAKVREQSMTGGDIMYQEAYQCAVKIVVNNKPIPVVQLAANFVPKADFEVAKLVVDEDAAEVWLRQRRLYGEKPSEGDEEILSVEESEELNEQYKKKDDQYINQLNPEMIDFAVGSKVDPHPRDKVVYKNEGENQIGAAQKPIKAERLSFVSPFTEEEEPSPTVVPPETEVGDTLPKSVLDSTERKTSQANIAPELMSFVSEYNDEPNSMNIEEPEEVEKEVTKKSVSFAEDYEESILNDEEEAFFKNMQEQVNKVK